MLWENLKLKNWGIFENTNSGIYTNFKEQHCSVNEVYFHVINFTPSIKYMACNYSHKNRIY